MTNDFSASTSGKSAKSTTGGTTPFDQITALENQEQERLQVELEAMQKEKAEVEQAIKDKEVAAEQELKDEARAELMQYRETELSQIVKTAEAQAEQDLQTLESTFEAAAKPIIDKLVADCSDPSTLLKAK